MTIGSRQTLLTQKDNAIDIRIDERVIEKAGHTKALAILIGISPPLQWLSVGAASHEHVSTLESKNSRSLPEGATIVGVDRGSDVWLGRTCSSEGSSGNWLGAGGLETSIGDAVDDFNVAV